MISERKLFILLFPQKEYVKGYFTDEDISIFNECIRTRYIEKGYEFCVANFKGSDLGIVALNPDKIANADITFEESSPYTCKDWRYADFNDLAKKIQAEKYSNVVVGGFHCYDCVEKLAKEIYSINTNIIIDTDLTENFRNSYLHEEDFKLDTFNPNIKLRRIFERDSVTPLGILEQMKERYSDQIWGISKETLVVIDKRIKETEEEYKKMNLYKKR